MFARRRATLRFEVACNPTSGADEVAAALDERYGDVIEGHSFCTAAPTGQEILDSICGDPKRAVHA